MRSTRTGNQLKAVLVGINPALREQLSGLSTPRPVRACAALEVTDPTADTSQAARHTLRLLAQRISLLTEQIDDLDARLTAVLADHAPDLLARNGVGPDTGATLLIAAGDNPDRLQSEAAFAALCGVSPVEASSRKTQRRRLNRGGNRQANAALHRVTLARLRWDPPPAPASNVAFGDGKTRREAIRGLKRDIARELYPLLTPPTNQTPALPTAA